LLLILYLHLPNFESSIFQGMGIIRQTCWLKRHMIATLVGVFFFLSNKGQ
jgi:hypothetical protein